MTLSTRGIGWGWLLAYGIVNLILGAFAIAMPVPATFAATLVIGAYLIAAGLFSLLAGIFGQGHEGRGYAILLGVISLIGGGIMVIEPATGALSLTLLLALWLIARGVLELAWGFRFRRRRGLMIALGVINLLLAAYIFYAMPISALTLPGIVLGVSFLFSGATWVLFALDHRGERVALDI
ncbi:MULTISPECIES: DUF308 domain-containing protein [unclassified Sphingomonas]|uniref:HdeD family acid-resistance protein n=1 Tax=unclassified Sphingomonas TaxID=196159 RepID=UPI00092C9309|nr:MULTISPECIES: DUF308 domain-containing protein [unclassified Sphingomonas]MBN8849844.1 DUF308 domain-containing protein [Sphingomonas sp.]OJV27913.1 MAG: hypothetical protein BGO24_02185 [Sphingomonas sp. 67-36]